MVDFVVASGLTQEQYDRVVNGLVTQFGPIPMIGAVPAVKDRDGKILREAIPAVASATPEEFARKAVWQWALNWVVESERKKAVEGISKTAEQKTRADFEGL